MLLKINPENPEGRKVGKAVEILREGGVVIYPTDTVYALGCDIENQAAIDRICSLRGLDPKRAMLTLMCRDMSQAAAYSPPLAASTFKFLKRNTPGPITFILPASKLAPKVFRNRKKTIGLRIPDHPIAGDLIAGLGRPLVTTSLKSDDEIVEYFTDPVDIYDDYGKRVDLVIHGGLGGNTPSTIVDLTKEEPALLREGDVFPQW